MATVKDPVCKMDVDTKNTEATSQHKGETYYFCGSDCKKEFDKKPERYAGKETARGK